MIASEKKGAIEQHTILVKEPHNQSLASLVYLTKKYLEETKEQRYNPWKYLKVRDRYMRKKAKENGKLTCIYCGKDHLDAFTKDLNFLATVDHVIPVSKGGRIYDESNFVVSCYQCNQKKGNRVTQEVKQTMPVGKLGG